MCSARNRAAMNRPHFRDPRATTRRLRHRAPARAPVPVERRTTAGGANIAWSVCTRSTSTRPRPAALDERICTVVESSQCTDEMPPWSTPRTTTCDTPAAYVYSRASGATVRPAARSSFSEREQHALGEDSRPCVVADSSGAGFGGRRSPPGARRGRAGAPNGSRGRADHRCRRRSGAGRRVSFASLCSSISRREGNAALLVANPSINTARPESSRERNRRTPRSRASSPSVCGSQPWWADDHETPAPRTARAFAGGARRGESTRS